MGNLRYSNYREAFTVAFARCQRLSSKQLCSNRYWMSRDLGSYRHHLQIRRAGPCWIVIEVSEEPLPPYWGYRTVESRLKLGAARSSEILVGILQTERRQVLGHGNLQACVSIFGISMSMCGAQCYQLQQAHYLERNFRSPRSRSRSAGARNFCLQYGVQAGSGAHLSPYSRNTGKYSFPGKGIKRPWRRSRMVFMT
jgi:hypothetical protein